MLLEDNQNDEDERNSKAQKTDACWNPERHNLLVSLITVALNLVCNIIKPGACPHSVGACLVYLNWFA